jgi:hypothetical protein
LTVSTTGGAWARKSGIDRASLKDLARMRKDSQQMFITQKSKSEPPRQGSHGSDLSQLRHELACPDNLTDDSRQRLLELDRRLTRLASLGGEHLRVGFSDAAIAALDGVEAVA